MAGEQHDVMVWWAGWVAWVAAALLLLVGFLALLSVGIVLVLAAMPVVAAAFLSWRHPSQLIGAAVGVGTGLAALGAFQSRAPRANCNALYSAADAAAFCPPPTWGRWLAAGLAVVLTGLVASVWASHYAGPRGRIHSVG